MAINYSIMLLGNPFDKNEPKKAYAKAQINGEMTLKELSTEVSKRSTVHRADVSGVLIATVECMFEALKSGKQVDFGELGKFRLQLSSDGAESAEKFTSNHITGASIQFIPGDDLKNLFANLDFNVVATRAAQAAVLKAQKAGETMVDISKPTSSAGGGSSSDGGNTDNGGGGAGSGDDELDPLG